MRQVSGDQGRDQGPWTEHSTPSTMSCRLKTAPCREAALTAPPASYRPLEHWRARQSLQDASVAFIVPGGQCSFAREADSCVIEPCRGPSDVVHTRSEVRLSYSSTLFCLRQTCWIIRKRVTDKEKSSHDHGHRKCRGRESAGCRTT